MSVTVTLGMVTWNNIGAIPLTLASLVQERERLETAGWHATIEIVDNASWDGTEKVLHETCARYPRSVHYEILGAPISSTTARNILIDRSQGDDYLAFVDGDIAVVPHSLVAFLHYLSDHDRLSAIAMDPLAQTMHPAKASPYCRSVRETRRDPLMYLCGYAMFRRGLFDALAFDEEGPLGQCGWGSEDDDLWLQMVEEDCQAVYAEGFTFYHGSPHGSWPSLQFLGIDPQTSFEARRRYVLDKWRERRVEATAPLLTLLQGQHVRAN